MGLKICHLAGFWHHYMTTMMCIVILCLEGEQKQICEQSLYVGMIQSNA